MSAIEKRVLITQNRGHLEQCSGGVVRLATSVPRLLINSTSEQLNLPYRKRRAEFKSLVHWGQRKLMISEIEFLTLYSSGKSPITCVYVGAAPGTHIAFLSVLFPNINFILVDPAAFFIESTPSTVIRQEFMTDELASSLASTTSGEDLLFISDIRTADHTIMSEYDVEIAVASDMKNQMRWVRILKPRASMLKFRLPWTEGETEYLDGDVFLPVWGPQTTSESRLVVTDPSSQRIWKNKVYQNAMFYFNLITRCCVYPHSVRSEGLDSCYDCAAEVKVLKEYIDSFRDTYASCWLVGHKTANQAVASLVSRLHEECSVRHKRDASVGSRNLVHWRSNRVFTPRIYDYTSYSMTILDNKSFADLNTDRPSAIDNMRALFDRVKASLQTQPFRSVPEVCLDDCNRPSRGPFGGTLVESDTAADIWVWQVVWELLHSPEAVKCSHHEPPLATLVGVGESWSKNNTANSARQSLPQQGKKRSLEVECSSTESTYSYLMSAQQKRNLLVACGCDSFRPRIPLLNPAHGKTNNLYTETVDIVTPPLSRQQQQEEVVILFCCSGSAYILLLIPGITNHDASPTVIKMEWPTASLQHLTLVRGFIRLSSPCPFPLWVEDDAFVSGWDRSTKELHLCDVLALCGGESLLSSLSLEERRRELVRFVDEEIALCDFDIAVETTSYIHHQEAARCGSVVVNATVRTNVFHATAGIVKVRVAASEDMRWNDHSIGGIDRTRAPRSMAEESFCCDF